jgi:hypothetical protein
MDLRTLPGPAPGSDLYHKLYSPSITERSAYEALFADYADRPQRGEASVRYLYYPQIASRIAQQIPDARIIVLLRDPVARLWSHYQMMKSRYDLEPATLDEALALEPERIASGWDYDWHYASASRYYRQLLPYFQVFGAERIHICFTNDLKIQTQQLLNELFAFLGVSPFQAQLTHLDDNAGHRPRSQALERGLDAVTRHSRILKGPPRRFLSRLKRSMLDANKGLIPPMPAHLRADLMPLFAEDIRQCEALLNRKMPWSVPAAAPAIWPMPDQRARA